MTRPRTVMIVDDEIDFLSSMQRLLRKEPYALLTVDNGKAALERLSAADVSIVVSDHMMPDMNGLTLLQQIRARHPKIITIMLTALSEIELAMQAINEAGVYKFFLKPVEILDFKVTLRRALEYLDLIEERNDLREQVRARDVLLQRLEQQHPGITHVERDAEGRVILKG